MNHPSTEQGRRGFTLIELLVVIGIIGVLLVIAMPAFENFGKKDINATATQLIGNLRLARQQAITLRKNVYMVFPSTGGLAYQPNDVPKILRSYAFLMQTNDNPQQFGYISEWKYLPQGVYFDDNMANTGTIFSTTPAPFPFPRNNASSRDMYFYQFKPNGRVYTNPGADSQLGKSLYITTARYYEPNAANSGILLLSSPPGVTNAVRINGKTGQAQIR